MTLPIQGALLSLMAGAFWLGLGQATELPESVSVLPGAQWLWGESLRSPSGF